MSDLRQRVRRTMLGPEPTEGAVRSATEVSVNDRNRLWAMNGELGRIQAELLEKIVARGVFILQRKGLIEKFNIDGRQVSGTRRRLPSRRTRKKHWLCSTRFPRWCHHSATPRCS